MRLTISDFPEVAVKAMHDVHVEEVAMINEIYALLDAVEAGSGDPALLADKVEAFLAHTHEHFAGEEQLMQEYAFPPYPMHKLAHDEFLHDLSEAVVQWKEDGNPVPIAHFMRKTLPAWMKEHIATMDFVTADFINMRS